MRSTLRLLGSSLLAAVLATVLLSWGCAWLVQTSWRMGGDVVAADSDNDVDGDPSRNAGVAWLTQVEADLVLTNRSENVFRTGIPMIRAPERIGEVRWLPNVASLDDPLPSGCNDEEGTAILSGWPMRAMVGVGFTRTSNSTPAVVHDSRWAIPVGSAASGRIILPLRPLWSGFAVNAILLTVLLAWLRGGVRAVRRARRRAAGRCLGCGHPLAFEQKACPECGRTC
ncbi:MAG: hypothetical protein JNM94_10780 [Phycisphaerae bacterium]|nr:hypothetical protein [Phycisphaerae bacterium]